MVESASNVVTTPGTVDEKAIKSIAASDYFRFLGEDKIRKVAEAIEKLHATDMFNEGRWMNPTLRVEMLRILGPELPQISETYVWMVIRRYKDLKRYYLEMSVQAEKKRLEEEAKAKLAAEKAAKAAAAAAAKAKAAPAAAAPAPASADQKLTAPADPKPAVPTTKT